MPELSRPTVRVHQSFIAAMAEFHAEGRGSAEDSSMIGSELREFTRHWSTPAGFADYVDWLRNQSLEDSPRPDGHVPSLPMAYHLDITSALVTCDVDNIASRKVIERNGGVFADQRSGKLRFWVPTD
ncbi:GNAT family N-acetyltransferase [Salinispora fenicalii]|uniref:GNAT family N-acetyltransferase n=1 Tax=Salinispora fenicalii TaxID=1137263 RepID=UPI00047FA481|nr:acetyltransferase [Salinispora fenicalii]